MVAPVEHPQGEVYDRKDAADDEEDVPGQAGPFQGAHQRLGVKLRAAGMPVAGLQAVAELQEADRLTKSM